MSDRDTSALIAELSANARCGTPSSYRNGCRCDLCKEAKRIQTANRRARNRAKARIAAQRNRAANQQAQRGSLIRPLTAIEQSAIGQAKRVRPAAPITAEIDPEYDPDDVPVDWQAKMAEFQALMRGGQPAATRPAGQGAGQHQGAGTQAPQRPARRDPGQVPGQGQRQPQRQPQPVAGQGPGQHPGPARRQRQGPARGQEQPVCSRCGQPAYRMAGSVILCDSCWNS